MSGGTNGTPLALTVTSLNVPGDPLPGAQTLLEASGTAGRGALVLEHRYGRGRIVVVASNTTWPWAMEAGAPSLFYRQIWRQALRAACGETEGGRVLRVSWSKPAFRPGDHAIAQVQAVAGGDIRLRATVANAEGARPLTAVPGREPRTWQVDWLVEARGVWTVQLTAERDGEVLEVYRKMLPIAPLPDEGSRLARPDDDLARLAARGGGVYVPEEQADTLAARLEALVRPATRVETRTLASDGPWFLLLALAVIMGELALRRRLNLL